MCGEESNLQVRNTRAYIVQALTCSGIIIVTYLVAIQGAHKEEYWSPSLDATRNVARKILAIFYVYNMHLSIGLDMDRLYSVCTKVLS